MAKVAHEDRLRIIGVIDEFEANPVAGGVLKGELSGLRCIRVGGYRVVYAAQDQKLVVLVVRIGPAARFIGNSRKSA